MSRGRACLAMGGFALAACAALTTTTASADPANPGYTFSRTPSHGKPGTVIHFEGSGCQYEGQPYEYARITLWFREKDGSITLVAGENYDIADDGSFSGDLTVPRDARPAHDLLGVNCIAADMVFPVAESDFTVDGPSTSPSPTRTPTPTPTPSRTPTPRPTVTRSPSPRPTPSRSAVRALPSQGLPVSTPSPSTVASSQPVDARRGPSALLAVAAMTLIVANGFGIRGVVRAPFRR